MTSTPNDIRARWRSELQRTRECIPIERLAEDLTPREHNHLAHCTRCQAELALWKEIGAEGETGSESVAVSAVAAEIARRLSARPQNVLPLPPSARRAWQRPALAAAAAVLAVVIGVGLFVSNREPAIEGPATDVKTYRSAAVDVISPVGDVAAAPTSLRWKAVADAGDYDVDVMEVDRTPLWKGSTASSTAALPSSLVAQFVPGKTILWQVKARRGQAIVADSGIQRFRVSTAR